MMGVFLDPITEAMIRRIIREEVRYGLSYGVATARPFTRLFHDRFEYMLNPDEKVKKAEFMRRYYGRYVSWYKLEWDLPPEEWTLPPYEITDHPAYKVALKLNNTRGSTVDELYLGANVEPWYAWGARIDIYVPSFTSITSNMYFHFGFEVPGEGGYCRASLLFNNASARLDIGLGRVTGGFTGKELDVTSMFKENDWNEVKLFWRPPVLKFYNVTTGQGAELVYDVDPMSFPMVAPFICNESSENANDLLKIRVYTVWHLDVTTLKAPVKIIDVSSIAAGGETHYDMDLLDAREIALTVRVTYDANATDGVRVYLLSSPDGVNFDAEDENNAFAYFDPGFEAGSTVQKTVLVDSLPRYLRILVRNLDSSHTTGAVQVWVTKVM